jgi:CRISPR-associated protein Cas1
MATLYVVEDGARLEREHGRLLVVKRDAVLFAAPLNRVDQVVVAAGISVTSPALAALLEAEIGLTLLDRKGEVQGHLRPPAGGHVALRRQQYARMDDPVFALAVSKAIVGAKVHNQRAAAMRLIRTHPACDPAAPVTMARVIGRLAGAPTLDVLRGLEGEAARAWFGVLRSVIAPDYGFTARRRRPPPDPVNALLSLGYTLLVENLVTACEIVGLDPHAGFFHTEKYGRPALALDLMEEFRSVIVDSVVLNLLTRGMVRPQDFAPGPEGGVYLKPAALRTFFHRYAARLQTTVMHPVARKRLTYQKCLEVQARRLRKVIEGEMAVYEGFATR